MNFSTQHLISPLFLVLAALTLQPVHSLLSTTRTTEELVFFDDFTSFDLKTWKHEITMGGGGNFEFQVYFNNRNVSYVQDSILYIEPKLTQDVFGVNVTKTGTYLDLWGIKSPHLCTSNYNWGCLRTVQSGYIINPITSASISTSNSFSFKYGRVEVRAKMPEGDWLWPAIWLYPTYETYGTWPASGEIDIAEARGNKDYTSTVEGGCNTVSSTLHWGPGVNNDAFALTRQSKRLSTPKSFADNFHVYGLYWNADQLYTYVDSEDNKLLQVNFSTPFWQRAIDGGYQDWTKLFNPWYSSNVTGAPFDQEMFLIVNLAVGGNANYWDVDNRPWGATNPFAMTEFWLRRHEWLPTWKSKKSALQIDYVKIWQFKPPIEKK